jgi:uncharacterized protein
VNRKEPVTEGLWKWSPDARFLRTDNGGIAVNFATAATLAVNTDDGRAISSFSGLATTFPIPAALSGSAFEGLVRIGCLIAELRADEAEQLVRLRLAAALENSFGFIVMPTEKCNFRCKYCYESFAKGRMADTNVLALERAIIRTAGEAPQFGLGFFGGEPLLVPDIVLRLSQRAFEVTAGRGLPYAASVATNGSLLSPGLFAELIDAGIVGYQITIDGPQHIHDSQRVTAGGKSTFAKIVKNLQAMADSAEQFHCVLRCNVRDRDRAALLELADSSEFEFVRNDPRFVVDVHEIWSSDRREVSAANSGSCASDLPRGVDLFVLNQQLAQRGLATVTYSKLAGVLGRSCYAGKPNWFVVGADLQLYKCTVVFDNDRNQVGHIAADGSVVIDAEKNELWTASNALTDQGCSGCHFRVPCGGIACPLTRFTSGLKSCLDVRDPATLQRWAVAHPLSNENTSRPKRWNLPIAAAT